MEWCPLLVSQVSPSLENLRTFLATVPFTFAQIRRISFSSHFPYPSQIHISAWPHFNPPLNCALNAVLSCLTSVFFMVKSTNFRHHSWFAFRSNSTNSHFSHFVTSICQIQLIFIPLCDRTYKCTSNSVLHFALTCLFDEKCDNFPRNSSYLIFPKIRRTSFLPHFRTTFSQIRFTPTHSRMHHSILHRMVSSAWLSAASFMTNLTTFLANLALLTAEILRISFFSHFFSTFSQIRLILITLTDTAINFASDGVLRLALSSSLHEISVNLRRYCSSAYRWNSPNSHFLAIFRQFSLNSLHFDSTARCSTKFCIEYCPTTGSKMSPSWQISEPSSPIILCL